MNWMFMALVGLMRQYFEPRFNAKLKLLVYQIGTLHNRIHATKIVPTEVERLELLRLGASLDHDIQGLMSVVRPETYQTWVRSRRRGNRGVL